MSVPPLKMRMDTILRALERPGVREVLAAPDPVPDDYPPARNWLPSDINDALMIIGALNNDEDVRDELAVSTGMPGVTDPKIIQLALGGQDPVTKEDPEFSRFVDRLNNSPRDDIEAKLREAIADGSMVMRDNGVPVDVNDLNMSSLRIDWPDELTEDSTLGLYIEKKDGTVVQNSQPFDPPVDVKHTPGMRGYIWPGPVPSGPRKCPRCGDTWIPINEAPGQYQGAMSRVRVGKGTPATEQTQAYASRSVEICSPCGQDEAMGRGVIPIEEWPIGVNEFHNQWVQKRVQEAFLTGEHKLVNEATGELVEFDPDSPLPEVSIEDGQAKITFDVTGKDN